MADLQTFWAVDFWATGFWADDFWAGASSPAVVMADGGGDRYGRKRYAAPPQARTVPVDGTLYREMFPNQPARFSDHLTPAESPAATANVDESAVPLALLAAFMAFDED